MFCPMTLFTPIINVKISADTTNYNLFTALGSPGPVNRKVVMVTVESGVTVGSTSTATPAFRTGAFGAGWVLRLNVLGRIQGKGGVGGNGVSAGNGSPGLAGGVAILAERSIAVKGDGEVFSGAGGGGASGGGSVSGVPFAGAGGGGAAGTDPGNGGTGSDPGSPGTSEAGGPGGSIHAGTVNGGVGGGPGLAGEQGDDNNLTDVLTTGGAGGAAGAAIDGVSLVTFDPGHTLDIRGGQIN